MGLYLSIPGYYDNSSKKLQISALDVDIPVDSLEKAEKALLKHAQNALDLTITSVSVSTINSYSKVAERGDMEALLIEFKDWNVVLDYILEKEPLVETMEKKRKAKKSSHLVDLSPEDVVNYGYDYGWADEKKD